MSKTLNAGFRSLFSRRRGGLKRGTAGTALTRKAWEDVLQAIYLATLGRPADPSGLKSYGDALSDGWMTPAEAVREIEQTDEAKRYLMVRIADPLIGALYTGILGRAASPAEISGWRDVLLNGGDVDRLIHDVENSPEGWQAQLNRILARQGIQSIILAERKRRDTIDG